jgi:phosphomethylpyrimidine synthase
MAHDDRPTYLKARAPDAVRTQMHYARQGVVTPEVEDVAQAEHLSPEVVRGEVARGRMVIPANVNHPELQPVGIGIGARCKINANIGNSPLTSDIRQEVEKLELCVRLGSDTVMDLSTGKNIHAIREAMLRACPVPLGTVPLYEAVERVDNPLDLTVDLLFQVIEEQARQGVDYMTVHAGLLWEHVPLVKDRLTGIVSRGGSLVAQWMMAHGQQNPLHQHFDRLLDIASRHDVTLSLGDGLRPGCLHDASDAAQFAELATLGELTKRAWARDVQVMIEGPGHVPLDQVELNVRRERELCHDAPFYVLGPLVTDIGAGYDHVTSAIGGALAAFHGVSMICYVTPKEHLGLPNLEDVRQGIMAHKIAAHAADIGRKRPGARDRDDAMARARYAFDWEKQFSLCLDGERARAMRDETLPHATFKSAEFCSMCGPKFCAMRISGDVERLCQAGSGSPVKLGGDPVGGCLPRPPGTRG